MATISRKDLIDDDAIHAPTLLGESFKSLLDSLQQIIAKTKELTDGLSGMNTSTVHVKNATQSLTQEQKSLNQIQNQIAVQISKQSDEYIRQSNVLQRVKQETKEKTDLGNREATSINAQNSSIKELTAALNANRTAYANLRNEHERGSSKGKELLKVIQDQDKSLKELTASVGQNQLKVGDYKGQLEELLSKFGDTGSKITEVFHTIGEVAVSGWGVAAAAIGGATFALKQYFELTEQGQIEQESFLTKIEAKWAHFKNSIAQGVENLRGPRNEEFELDQRQKDIDKIDDNEKTKKQLQDELNLDSESYFLAKSKKEVAEEELAVTISREEELAKAAKLELVARDSANKSAKERLEAITEADAIYKKVNKEDIELFTKKMGLQNRTIYLMAEGRDLLIDEKKKIDDNIAAIIRMQSDFDLSSKKRASMISNLTNETKGGTGVGNKENEDLNPFKGYEEDWQQYANASSKLIKEEYDKSKESIDQQKKDEEDFTKFFEDEQRKRDEQELKAVDKRYSKFKENQKKEEQLANEKREKEKALVNASSDAVDKIVNDQFNYQASLVQNHLAMLSETYSEEMAIAGNNQAAKIQLTNEYRAKEKEAQQELIKLKVEQAEFDKAVAAFKIGLTIAEDIASMNYVGAAIAAIELVAVEAKPLPKYAEGTESHSGGLAVVGEEGMELVRTPTGGLHITPASASVVDLPTGSQVFTNQETLKLFAMAGFNSFDFKKQNNDYDSKILKELKQLNKNSSNKTQSQPNYARMAAGVYEFKKESDTFTRQLRTLYMGQNHK